ncbi:hypothetical protein V8F20_003899 [Naviculisporaceae sp. PSN 640]
METAKPLKKSLLQRYRDAKRGVNRPRITDEDLIRYTGMTRSQIIDWGKNRPNVAGNQASGTLTVGITSGLGLSGITMGDAS